MDTTTPAPATKTDENDEEMIQNMASLLGLTVIHNNESESSSESEPDFVDTPTNDVVPSFSFSGCGFLGVYHVGVAACLREHTDVVNRPEIKFAGASAGALVATTLLCGMSFGEMAKILLEVATAVSESRANNLSGQLRALLNHYLPEDAHVRMSGRLYISMTVISNSMECGMVSEFESKNHLIECLLATCYVPGFLGWLPPSIPAESFMDSGTGFPKLSEEAKQRRRERRRRDADNDEQPRASREEEKLKAITTESILDVISNTNWKPADDDRTSFIGWIFKLWLQSLNMTSTVIQKLPLTPRAVADRLGAIDEILSEIVRYMIDDEHKYMSFDGGFSDNLPSFDANTITVCPFSGESDICPRDLTACDLSLDLGNTSMHFSHDNIYRLSHALNPMDPEKLQKLCKEGYDDCLRYLEKKDLLCCKKHLMTRATLHSSPCNIGHAHCKCDICQEADAKIRVSLSCVPCQKAKREALESSLPADVMQEFQKSIRRSKRRPQTSSTTAKDSYWNQFLSKLWWTIQKMYAGTICLAELAVRFQIWFTRFMDNYAIMAREFRRSAEVRQKFIANTISSLHRTLSAVAAVAGNA